MLNHQDLVILYYYLVSICIFIITTVKLILNYIILDNQYLTMNWLRNWWKGSKNPQEDEHNHSQITHYCCSDICHHDRQVCAECTHRHKGHTLMQHRRYRFAYDNLIQQINNRKKIQSLIRQHNQTLITQFEQLLQKQTCKFLQELDKKIFGKNFIEIYKKYLGNKNFYSYVPEYQNLYVQEINGVIAKRIKQKQKKANQFFKLYCNQNRILVEEDIIAALPRIRDYPNQTKIDKVRSLLPFKCQLNPKFQASKLDFQTFNLHKTGIRGPILVVAESYKGMIFGGFSPKMFPKEEYYEQDNRCRSFLFSLDHRQRLPLKEQYKKYAIKGGNNLWFGRGDLVIADQCNKANISWAQIGRAYELPKGIKCDPAQWLAGALYFRIVQYEIYEVQSPSFGGR